MKQVVKCYFVIISNNTYIQFITL